MNYHIVVVVDWHADDVDGDGGDDGDDDVMMWWSKAVTVGLDSLARYRAPWLRLFAVNQVSAVVHSRLPSLPEFFSCLFFFNFKNNKNQ